MKSKFEGGFFVFEWGRSSTISTDPWGGVIERKPKPPIHLIKYNVIET